MGATLEVPTMPSRRAFLGGGMLSALRAAESAPVRPAEAAGANPLDDPRIRIRHLLRRAGFGATPQEVDQFVAMGYEATVDWLLNYDDREDAAEAQLASLEFDFTKREDLKRWWFVRMLTTNRPLQEKMTLFWHGLLTSGFSKVNNPLEMKAQNELLRANALGNFQNLVTQISTDAAMLRWLDGNNSRRKAPNENYARELMELFTMGIGNYTETDVKESARAFTGWTVNKDGAVTFNSKQWDDGVKTFLGETGRFNASDIVAIIVRKRVTAEYIAKRLFGFFGYRNPDRNATVPLADVFQSSGYNIKAVMRALLLSPEFSSPQAYRALVKSPVELVVGVHRDLGIASDGAGLAGQTRAMGQDLLDPPNVAGWPGGPAWLNSATWMQRVNWLNSIATRRKGEAGTVLALPTTGDPRRLSQTLVAQLLDGNLDADRRAAIEGYVYDGAPGQLTVNFANRQGRHLAYLLLASPEYQLA